MLGLLSSINVFSAPMAVNEPIVIITREEFDAMAAEVKKLYDDYKKLESYKTCKKT